VTTKLVRSVGALGLLFCALAPRAAAADPKEVEKAIKGGTDALAARYARGVVAPDVTYGIGPTALTGLALLEAGVPVTDPAVKNVTEMVRGAAYKQHETYQIALCLMYLDRRRDPADVPLIQLLAVRLLVGQTRDGGWGYECVAELTPADAKQLQANLKKPAPAGAPPGGAKERPKLHPEVERYAQAFQNRGAPGAAPAPASRASDNSNTQFAVLAVWLARKHGAPVEDALDLVEKRFVATQDPATGIWSYNGGVITSPSMYCSGLLGLAPGFVRRAERQPKNNPGPGARPDPRELTAQRAFTGLGLTLAAQLKNGKGVFDAKGLTDPKDLYFLWSLERVCAIYGVDNVGGIDWYDTGATVLLRAQRSGGTWNVGAYEWEVCTAFAVLVLCKSNLARDLNPRVKDTELRAGTGPSATDPKGPNTAPGGGTAVPPPPELPGPTSDAAQALAAGLLKATGADWKKQLGEARDGKGSSFTQALAVVAERAEGDRKKEARDALAQRLCRMTAPTLRGMLKADETELRRAAALACAMKDDKEHIPDLVAALTDTDEVVVRAARAGLKSLAGQDFGPAPGATSAQKAAAAAAWRAWLNKKK
jgi:hypothetical protein